MTIVAVSVSHRSTPVEVLERLCVPAGHVDGVLASLKASPAIDEVVVLSTCNRVEVYAVTRGLVGEVARAVAGVVGSRGSIPAGEFLQTACVRVDGAAVEHLFTVACGLDSMAVGEDQIVAQIRAAARAATQAGVTGPVLTGLVDAALRVSKRARTETAISSAGVSLARAGLDLARAQLGGLATRHAVVLGTGSAGKLAARLLREAGVGRLSVAGRSESAAAHVAAAVDGRPLRALDVPAELADADLLVTATGSVVPVVLARQVRTARVEAGERPLFVLDLGMPPDVEPAVGLLAGVTLVDIKALGGHLADQQVPDEIPRVRAIVAAEVAAYLDGQGEAAAAPFIGAMHAHVRRLADAELLRLHGRLPDLSEQQRAETSATVYRVLRKFLHGPTVRARRMATDPDGLVYVEALRQIFDPSVSEATP